MGRVTHSQRELSKSNFRVGCSGSSLQLSPSKVTRESAPIRTCSTFEFVTFPNDAWTDLPYNAQRNLHSFFQILHTQHPRHFEAWASNAAMGS